jgi:DNA-binding IclR family transcriptional regulator
MKAPPGRSLIMRQSKTSRAASEEAERRYRAPALEKGLDILELMASEGAPMTPSLISARLDRSMSELFRMILVLEYKGYIVQSQAGDGYELSNKLFTLGMSRAPVKSLLERALPVMRELCEAVGQSCHLAVASDDQMVVIARIENPGQLGLSVRPGYRRSLAHSTSGTVLFAFQPPEVQGRWIETLTAVGALDAKSAMAFRARGGEVRARGFEQFPSRHVEGVTDLSAPVMGGPAAVAALTIPFVRSVQMSCGLEEAVERLRGAAAKLSEDVGAGV